jgi:hypothetical protein
MNSKLHFFTEIMNFKIPDIFHRFLTFNNSVKNIDGKTM